MREKPLLHGNDEAYSQILIYEELDGHPIYRKGCKDFVLGLKIEEVPGSIVKYLNKHLPE